MHLWLFLLRFGHLRLFGLILRNLRYLKNPNSWSECQEPKNVVQFNMGLFITLMVASVLQGLLCASQVINGFVGCICGTCNDKQVRKSCVTSKRPNFHFLIQTCFHCLISSSLQEP